MSIINVWVIQQDLIKFYQNMFENEMIILRTKEHAGWQYFHSDNYIDVSEDFKGKGNFRMTKQWLDVDDEIEQMHPSGDYITVELRYSTIDPSLIVS